MQKRSDDMLNTKKLNELMKAAGFNARSLALAAGLPQATVWRTVRGDTSPSLETLKKICVPLRVRPSELLIETDSDYKRAA